MTDISNKYAESLPGMAKRDPLILLGINWLVLICCFITIYFSNQVEWSVWIFLLMILPLASLFFKSSKNHWHELFIQTGMTSALLISFFTGWAPPVIVLLFLASVMLSMVFMLRPWGGGFLVLTAMIISIPIAVSMMGYYAASPHHPYAKMAVLFAAFIMNGTNAYFIAKQNKATRNESVRARQLVGQMNEVHHQFATEIAPAKSLSETFRKLVELSVPALNLEVCTIYLSDTQSNELKQVAAFGAKVISRTGQLSPNPIPFGSAVIGRVAESGSPLIVAKTEGFTDNNSKEKGRKSELAVPIIFDGKVFAVIDSEHSQSDFFTEDHLAIFEMIATLCSNKIGELSLLHSEVDKAKAEKELSQINELEKLRNTFINNLSHDLRTPLSLIKGPLQELQKMPDKDVNKLSDIAFRNAERLNDMVSGLLDMHKLERGGMTPYLSDSDLHARIKEWYALFSHKAEVNNIAYTLTMDEMPILNCDISKLGQIFQNLLSNAFKFTPNGGEVRISATWIEGQFLLEIGDSGPGIPEAERQKVFDRFYKIDHDSHIEGTGIGLAMVNEYVRLLNGTVRIGDTKNGGALFTIELPIKQSEEKSIVQPSELEMNDESKPLIALIEDHPEMNSFITSLLSETYSVLSSTTAEEGWQQISDYLPDLVITDLMLPGMSGEMLCKRIKSTLATDHLPVLALSAKQNTETRIEMYGYGADNYITKPFDTKELLSVVASLISQRKKLREKFGLKTAASAGAKTEGMRRIDSEIADNLSNTEYSPRDLEKVVGITRNQLQRKVKSVTGFTPVEYIRVTRLQMAQKLLKQGGMNVSEVAYHCGFNQLSYFSKSYKSFFSVSPSEDIVTTRPENPI